MIKGKIKRISITIILMLILQFTVIAILGIYSNEAFVSSSTKKAVYETNDYKISYNATIGNSGYRETYNAYITGITVKGTGKNITIPGEFDFEGNKYKVRQIPSNLFKNNKQINEVNISKDIHTIDEGAFEGSSVTKVTISNGNVSMDIGENVFRNCKSLKEVNIANMISAEKNMFAGCTNLTTVNLTNTVYEIKENAFEGCSKLKELKLKSEVWAIGNNAFNGCTSLTSINISGSNLTKSLAGERKIGTRAFYNCKKLESITIPSGIKKIENNAFNNCTSLKNITIPSGVTSLGDYAFYNCSNLQTVTIEEGITQLRFNVFSGCNNLKEITIPKSVKSKNDIAVDALPLCANYTIYCYKGSGAEAYAKSHGEKYVIFDEVPNITVNQTGNSLNYSIRDNNSGLRYYIITDPGGRNVGGTDYGNNPTNITYGKSGSIPVTKSGTYKIYAINLNNKSTTKNVNITVKSSRKE